MADRPIWRGHLRLALVSCPVALHSARHERNSLHFHLINPDTGNRVRMVTLDAETEQEVTRRELVRGYEFKKDTYVLLDDEDFERARIDSSSTITVEKFVTANSIDPIYFDSSYYLAPDGDQGEDVYAVLREAIASSGRVALSRVVMSRRERTIAIMPMGRGLVVHTLHEAGDINDAEAVFADVPAQKPDAAMVKLAAELIDRQTEKFTPADMTDRYEARLRKLIEAKVAGAEDIDAPEEEEDRGNVVDLMAALKKSLGQATKPVKRSGKPTAGEKTGRTKAAPASSSKAGRGGRPAPKRKRA